MWPLHGWEGEGRKEGEGTQGRERTEGKEKEQKGRKGGKAAGKLEQGHRLAKAGPEFT